MLFLSAAHLHTQLLLTLTIAAHCQLSVWSMIDIVDVLGHLPHLHATSEGVSTSAISECVWQIAEDTKPLLCV